MELTSGRVLRLLARTAEYTALQTFVQALGFLVGLIVIRSLTKQEYFYFTVASSIAGTVAVLSDLGLSNAALSLSGRVSNDAGKTRALLNLAISDHALLCGFAVTAGLLAGSWLLRNHGVSWHLSVFVTFAACIAGVASSRYALGSVLPRLENNLRLLQKIDAVAAVTRLVLVGPILLVAPYAVAIVTMNALTLAGQAWWSVRASRKGFAYVRADTDAHQALRKLVWRQAPPSLLYVFHGQLTVWLLAIFGTSSAVAEYGALGRLAAVLAIANSVVSAIAFPYFARTHNRSELVFGFLSIGGSLAAVVIGLTIATAAAPSQILWLLGQGYRGLELEVVPMVCAVLLSAAAATLYGINLSKGWIIPPIAFYSIWGISVVVGINVFDVSTVKGAALLTIFTSAVSVMASSVLFVLNVRRMAPETSRG